MSTTNITIPPELDEDVNEWNENHVDVFLTENKKKYQLKDEDIKSFQDQEVAGRNLLESKAEDFEFLLDHQTALYRSFKSSRRKRGSSSLVNETHILLFFRWLTVS